MKKRLKEIWKDTVKKDFKKADQIRNELSDLGILLDDGPDGTTWKIE